MTAAGGRGAAAASTARRVVGAPEPRRQLRPPGRCVVVRRRPARWCVSLAADVCRGCGPRSARAIVTRLGLSARVALVRRRRVRSAGRRGRSLAARSGGRVLRPALACGGAAVRRVRREWWAVAESARLERHVVAEEQRAAALDRPRPSQPGHRRSGELAVDQPLRERPVEPADAGAARHRSPGRGIAHVPARSGGTGDETGLEPSPELVEAGAAIAGTATSSPTSDRSAAARLHDPRGHRRGGVRAVYAATQPGTERRWRSR